MSRLDIRIRRAEPADYIGISRTMSTPRAYAGTLQQPLPSLEMWRERLAKYDADSRIYVAEVPATDGGDSGSDYEIVGHISLGMAHKNPRRQHAYGLGMSVRDDWQGRGVGAALMATAIDMADHWLNVLRLELTVFVDNTSAVRLYQRFGFETEGRHRAYALRNGVYVDVLSMARLHPHPPDIYHSAPDNTVT